MVVAGDKGGDKKKIGQTTKHLSYWNLEKKGGGIEKIRPINKRRLKCWQKAELVDEGL